MQRNANWVTCFPARISAELFDNGAVFLLRQFGVVLFQGLCCVVFGVVLCLGLCWVWGCVVFGVVLCCSRMCSELNCYGNMYQFNN